MIFQMSGKLRVREAEPAKEISEAERAKKISEAQNFVIRKELAK